MSDAPASNILVEIDDGVGLITIHRPDKRNALDLATHEQVAAAFDRLAADRAVRVGVITGEGKAFVAGADVHEFVGQTPVDILRKLRGRRSAIDAADAFPKPLIAMINGYCLASGNELALACDIRIASEEAKFGQPEINLGMIPGGGATQRLPRLAGLGTALGIMYTGVILDSQEAFRMGIVDLVVPAAQLRDRTMTLARVIASRSPTALALIKEAARASMRSSIEGGVKHEQTLASLIFSSKDVQEGLAAFLEKRQPRFTGE